MGIKITVNSNSSSANEEDCLKLEEKIRVSKGLNDLAEAQQAICALCQAGGTNNASGNLSVTISDPDIQGSPEKKLSLKEVKDAIKTTNLKLTLRQYARNRSIQCHDVGEKFGIPGDLTKKLTHQYGSMSVEDSYWASSFQMDSDACPASIREKLVAHYNSLFGRGS